MHPDVVRLYFGGTELQDSSSLEDYNIRNESFLYLTLKLRGGALSVISFNSMRNENIEERKFEPYDPENLRIVNNGVNAQGICKTQSCRAYDQTVFAHLGYGNKMSLYNIIRITGKCYLCNQLMRNIDNFCFVRSKWFFKGRYADGTKINTKDTPNFTKNNGYSIYKQGEDTEWAFLEITVEPHHE